MSRHGKRIRLRKTNPPQQASRDHRALKMLIYRSFTFQREYRLRRLNLPNHSEIVIRSPITNLYSLENPDTIGRMPGKTANFGRTVELKSPYLRQYFDGFEHFMQIHRNGLDRELGDNIDCPRIAQLSGKCLLKKLRHCQAGFVYVAVVIHGVKALVRGILFPELG